MSVWKLLRKVLFIYNVLKGGKNLLIGIKIDIELLKECKIRFIFFVLFWLIVLFNEIIMEN